MLANPRMIQVLSEVRTVGMSDEGREYYYMHTDDVPTALVLLQVQYTTQGRQRLHNFSKFEKFLGSGT